MSARSIAAECNVTGDGVFQPPALNGRTCQQQHELSDHDTDLNTRTSDILAQAASGFSLEPSSCTDIQSLLSSELGLAQSRQWEWECQQSAQMSTNSKTSGTDAAPVYLLDSVDPNFTASPSQTQRMHHLHGDVDLSVLPDAYSTAMEAGGLLDLDSIPDEILLLCFKYLKPKELCLYVAPVCQSWHRLAYDASFWRELDFSEGSASSQHLCQIVQKVPGAIRYLHMSGVNSLKIDDMAVIAECCPELTHLDVGFVEDFSASMLQLVLAACPRLSFLNVEGCRLANNEMMRTLANTKTTSLKQLNFSHCSLVDESLALLVKDVPGITHLNIDGIAWISESGVQQIATAYLDSLESLELDGNELSDKSVNCVSQCHKLHTLAISFCERLTDRATKYLLNLTHLKKLVLRKGLSFSAGCLQELFSSPAVQHLTYLDLTECQQLEDRAAIAIAQSCGASLKMLILSWCWEVTDHGMEAVARRCPHMVKMTLVGLHRLEGSWLPLALETMPHLKHINFEQCNEVSDVVIEDAVRAKPDLTILNYYGEIFVHSGAL